MNLPNKLTMLRVILVPVFMVFAAYSRYGTADFNPTFALIAGIIFAVASFTDFLDGYLARKNNLVTDFGKFMDPLADKCLTTAAFIYMVACGICSPVVLAVILFREFAVAGVRMLAAETGTRCVIREHATVGLVVTTDGSVADLPREAYLDAERRIIAELDGIGKPYIILLNCAEPST